MFYNKNECGGVILQKLRGIRGKYNLSHKDMSKLLGISKPYYWQIENRKRGLSYQMAVNIAKIFNLKPDDIFYEEFTNKKIKNKD
ncbi:MAG: helix-turn-helix transcriptional regulator [Bacilli bacterium]